MNPWKEKEIPSDFSRSSELKRLFSEPQQTQRAYNKRFINLTTLKTCIWCGIFIQCKTTKPWKKNEIMLFPSTEMDLDIITLCEVSQRQILYHTAYMWNLKWTYFQNRKRLTNIENKLMVTMGEWREGEGINREVGFNIHHYI